MPIPPTNPNHVLRKKDLVSSDDAGKVKIDPATGVMSVNGIAYSTDEVKTADTWFDGKPVYRRTIQLPTSYAFKIGHNYERLINEAIFDRVLDVKVVGAFEGAGYCRASASGYVRTYNSKIYYNFSKHSQYSVFGLEYYNTDTSEWTCDSIDMYVTVWYTKLTD
jgi:hypothetical protein